MYGALLHGDKTPKNLSAVVVVAADGTDGRTFLSVAHTKCPSGKHRKIFEVLDILEISPPLVNLDFETRGGAYLEELI